MTHDTAPSGKRRILALVLTLPLIAAALVVAGIAKGVVSSMPNLGLALEGVLRFVVLGALFYGVIVKLLKFDAAGHLGATMLNKRRGAALVLGLGLAAAAVSIAAAGAVIIGGASLSLNVQGPAEWFGSLLRTTGGVAFEELAFRCGWMALLWPLLPRKVIVPLTALPFVLLHAGNEGATVVGLANAFLLSVTIGVLFFWRDDGGPDWWAALGFHFAWNAGLSLVGSAVSGAHRDILFRLEGGDALWAGGAFGLEASAATTVGGLLVFALALMMQRRQARPMA